MSDESQKTPRDATRGARGAAQAGVDAATTAANAGADAARATASAGAETARAGLDAGFAGMNEFTRLFADMKLPGLPDMQALMDAHRRNLETLSAANRVALEGAQAVARRHMEIMQQSMSELSETMQALASVEGPQVKAAKQAEMLKRAYERAVSNMRELRDLIQRSNGEALELLNRRFAESLDEMQALIRQANEKF
jgi:phasin family protein